MTGLHLDEGSSIAALPANRQISRRNAKQEEAPVAMEIWDLAAADETVRFSPYCWRIHFALAHKGMSAATHAWRFTDKDAIAFSGQGFVPVLRDGDHVVSDSFAIAEYLDAAYPERPLMGGAQAA
eukprot:gene28026-31129_t